MSTGREESPGLATNHVPIVVDLRPGTLLLEIISSTYRRHAWEFGTTSSAYKVPRSSECQCPWNTPLLPVKESGRNDYRPVQGLCDITSAVVTVHPVVPDPYLLLTSLALSRLVHLPRSQSYILLALALASLPASMPLKGKTHLLGGRHS